MLRGTLDDFTLADVFKLLSFSKKTGRIELKRRAGMGRVFFRDGDVYYAESSLSREPLGQKLIRSRALTESHLRRALDEHADSGERVGQILLRENWVTEEQLEDAVKRQIEDAVFDLLRWDLGDFEWEPNATLEPEVALSVSVENLIMEASRRLDELEIIHRKVPTSHAVVAVAPAPPEGAVEINITPDEWRVLVLVDGHRTVETIANTIGLDEFHTMKIVHGMVSAGLVEVTGTDEAQVDLGAASASGGEPVVDPVQPPPPPPPMPEILDRTPQHLAPASTELEEHGDAGERGHTAEEATETSFEDTAAETDEDPENPVAGTAADPVPDTHGAVAAGVADQAPAAGASSAIAEEARVEEVFAWPTDLGSGEGSSSDDLLSLDEAVQEETLYEAPPEGAGRADTGSPPEEWFADPDLSTELFDPPSPGDLLTELPDAPVTDEGTSTEANGESADPVGSALEVPSTDADEVSEMPKSPPPPPVAPVEGADRTRAVRELSGLFSDEPVERPRPVLRRIDPADPNGKRRVEDDEQVTKSLISRLIEGVKGL